MKDSMIENRKMSSNRMRGIERVKQRKGDMEVGQGGKMHNSPSEKARFKRDGKMTPKGA